MNGGVDGGVNDCASSAALFGRGWDVIVGSDLVYDEAGVAMLPSKLALALTLTVADEAGAAMLPKVFSRLVRSRR